MGQAIEGETREPVQVNDMEFLQQPLFNPPKAKAPVSPARPDVFRIMLQTRDVGIEELFGAQNRQLEDTIVVREVDARVWDTAYEHRYDFLPRGRVVARGRNHEIEAFTLLTATMLRRALNKGYVITEYRLFDPISLYPGRTRSQRTIAQRLTDAIYDAMKTEQKHVDYAVLADGAPSKAMLIINFDKEMYDPEAIDFLRSVTINSCTYQALGYILDNEPVFHVAKDPTGRSLRDENLEGEELDKALAKYLSRRDGADYVQYRWLDRTTKPSTWKPEHDDEVTEQEGKQRKSEEKELEEKEVLEKKRRSAEVEPVEEVESPQYWEGSHGDWERTC